MNQTPTLRPQFWQNIKLQDMTNAEWEALCDGCGLCCLVKLEDEDTGQVEYTKISCKLLDCKTAQCTDYANRQKQVPDCLQLTVDNLAQMPWLPSTCAYRRVYEGKTLPRWHYLLTGSHKSIKEARKTAAGRCISELAVPESEQEVYIVKWVR